MLFYIKLPRWFQIETPVRPYNPDWAVAYRNDRHCILAETNKTGNGGHVQLDLLRPIENLRIEYGKRFQELRAGAIYSGEFARGTDKLNRLVVIMY